VYELEIILAVSVIAPLIAPERAFAATTIATPTTTKISAYSAAEAPDSSVAKFFRKFVITLFLREYIFVNSSHHYD
jgi:hypothetical protein